MNKAIRIITLSLIGIAFFALIIFNVNSKPDNSTKVWDMRNTVGGEDAKHLFILYTDLACPYCNFFSKVLMDNQSDFEQLLADEDILYEVRMTDFLYEYGESKPESSRQSAIVSQCATEQDKFWDYYHAAQQTLWDDYYSKGIGVSKTAERISDMPDDYWQTIAESAGLDKDKLNDCIGSEETAAKVDENTEKAYNLMANLNTGGMPFFYFEKLKTSGFDTSWGWDEVKQYYFLTGLGKN